MNLPTNLWEQVRRRAEFTCEYCGVTETDSGGPLTVDHFRPQSRGGSDDFDNLLYCCSRCNLHKADYWPMKEDAAALWNPRQEAASTNFLPLADGVLFPITSTGSFTLKGLRLNRTQLVALRFRRQSQGEESRLLARFEKLVSLLENLHRQQVTLLDEHRVLLDEHRSLLKALLTNK